jgi:hypothetical protein
VYRGSQAYTGSKHQQYCAHQSSFTGVQEATSLSQANTCPPRMGSSLTPGGTAAHPWPMHLLPWHHMEAGPGDVLQPAASSVSAPSQGACSLGCPRPGWQQTPGAVVAGQQDNSTMQRRYSRTARQLAAQACCVFRCSTDQCLRSNV